MNIDINGKTYTLDVEAAIKAGLLKEQAYKFEFTIRELGILQRLVGITAGTGFPVQEGEKGHENYQACYPLFEKLLEVTNGCYATEVKLGEGKDIVEIMN